MVYQNLEIEEFNDLLQQWNGKKVKVEKSEAGDLDETLIDLSAVTYANDDPTIDGYEPQHSLQLRGAGMIETTTNNYEALPSDLYEIPLEDNVLYEFDGNRFIVSNSRAVYSIELVE